MSNFPAYLTVRKSKKRTRKIKAARTFKEKKSFSLQNFIFQFTQLSNDKDRPVGRMKILEETKDNEPLSTHSEIAPVVFHDETLKMDTLTFKERFKKWFIFIQYPWSVWFIISTELCERFAFYGFKTILPLYLNEYLKFSPDSATSIVHTFIFLAYFTPLLGGFLVSCHFLRFFTQFHLCECIYIYMLVINDKYLNI